jgi:hypothetical protein
MILINTLFYYNFQVEFMLGLIFLNLLVFYCKLLRSFAELRSDGHKKNQ